MNRALLEKTLLDQLSCMWIQFSNGLPLNFEVNTALGSLDLFGDANANVFFKFADDLIAKTIFEKSPQQENGMNSPGILWDRLTILNCKYFFTSPDSPHFRHHLHHINSDIQAELKAVLDALNIAKSAKNILLAKEATTRQSSAPKLSKSLWDLQSSNLAMWINQDLLYTVNIDEISSERLREYIRFFSHANKIRNTAIEHIEIFYLQQIFQKGFK